MTFKVYGGPARTGAISPIEESYAVQEIPELRQGAVGGKPRQADRWVALLTEDDAQNL